MEGRSNTGLNPPNYAIPIPRNGLTNETHARIPGRIRAIAQPAPIGHVGQQYPAWNAQGSRNMRDRTVYSDDQIKLVD